MTSLFDHREQTGLIILAMAQHFNIFEGNKNHNLKNG